MLTFFRKIRKALLGSGQTRKYILYAIGEIALVVIGILIALQVNNWNEVSKGAIVSELLRQEKLTSIYHDLKEEVDHIRNIYEILENQYQGGVEILEILESHELEFKDTAYYYHIVDNTLSLAVIVQRQQKTWDGLKSSGQLDILRDDSLSTMLGDFFYLFDARIENFNEIPRKSREQLRELVSSTHSSGELKILYEKQDWRSHTPYSNSRLVTILNHPSVEDIISSITISSIVNLEFFGELEEYCQNIISYIENTNPDIIESPK